MTNSKRRLCGMLAMWRAARFALPLAVILMSAIVATQSAHAQTFTTLANVSGGLSHSGLVQDLAGNLYGNTSFGSGGFGTVFQVDTTGTVAVL